MNRFFAIVPLMLCAVMSQAAPMATKSNAQTQNSSMEGVVPDTESQEKYPPQTPPCLPECKPSKLNSAAEQDTEKKTGWVNGFRNVFKACYNVLYESLVGEKGILTNLNVVHKTDSRRTKKPKNEGGKSGGTTNTCCFFYNNAPPVHDGEDDGPTDETAVSTNCFWINNQTSNPGVLPPAVTPLIPGATTKSKSNQVNCCFVGKGLIKISKCIMVRVNPQFNCCSISLNAAVSQ